MSDSHRGIGDKAEPQAAGPVDSTLVDDSPNGRQLETQSAPDESDEVLPAIVLSDASTEGVETVYPLIDPTLPPKPASIVPALPEHPILTIVGYGLIFLVTSFGAGVFLSPILYNADRDILMRNAMVLQVFLWIVIAIVIGRHTYGTRLKQVIALRQASLSHATITIGLALPLAVVATKLLDWFSLMQNPGVSTVAANLAADNPLSFQYVNKMLVELAEFPFPVVVIVGCLLPAIGEELFFRGLVGRILLGRFGVVAGVLMTSLVFGVAHMNVPQGCYTFFLGIALHVVYLTTRSLWLPMLLHALNNLIAFGLLKTAMINTFHVTRYDGAAEIPDSLLVTASLTVCVLLAMLWKSRTYWLDEDHQRWSPDFATAEMPPAEVKTTIHGSRFSGSAVLIASIAYLLFAGSIVFAAPKWRALTAAHRSAALLNSEEFDQAKKEAERALKLDPGSAWPQVIQAYLSMVDGDHETALTITGDVIARNPKAYIASWAYSIQGSVYLMTGDYFDAIRACSRSIEIDPMDTVALLTRAAAHTAQEEFETALADCNEAVRITPDDGDAYRQRAHVLVEMGDYSRAIQDCGSALERFPPDYVWHIAFTYGTRGRANVELGNHRLGIKDLTRAVESSFDEAWLYFELGTAYMRDSDIDAAIANYNTAIALAPDDLSFYAARSFAFEEKGDLELAIRDLTHIIETEPGDPTVHEQRAKVYDRMGDDAASQADRELARGIRVDTSINMGRLNLESRNFAAAIRAFGDAVDLDANNIQAYLLRAEAFQGVGQIQRAVDDYSSILSITPEDSEVGLARAQLLIMVESYDDAIKDLSKHVDAYPQDVRGYYHRAIALRGLGREQEAEQDEAVVESMSARAAEGTP